MILSYRHEFTSQSACMAAARKPETFAVYRKDADMGVACVQGYVLSKQ